MNEDGCDVRGDFYLENSVGGPGWTAYLTPISDYLFPQVVALPNGSFVVLGETVRVTSGCTHCGVNGFGHPRPPPGGKGFVVAPRRECGAVGPGGALGVFRHRDF